VPYVAVSDAEYLESISKGVPDFVAQFVLEWVRNMNAGEWDEQTTDLASLIGHKPKSPAECFRDGYRTQ
jgi:NAD(P)H dehydrogenase (quinone)